MGVFGEFIYGGESVGGDVYGPDEAIRSDILAENVIILQLDSPVVVNNDFLSLSNYSISLIEGPGNQVNVRSIIRPQGLTTSTILLEIDPPTKGATYQVGVGSLDSESGSTIEGFSVFIARRTKLDNMLRFLPNHWDSRPRSLIRQVLTAISIEDERIGGSRSDEIGIS